MTDILTQPEPQTEEEYEAAFAEILEEMQRLRKIMDADQIEIEQLKAETHDLKVETRAILAQLTAMVKKPC